MRTVLSIIVFIALAGLAYFFMGSPEPSSNNTSNITLDNSSSGCERVLEAIESAPEAFLPTSGDREQRTFTMRKPFERLGNFVPGSSLPDGFPTDAPIPDTFTVIGSFSDKGVKTTTGTGKGQETYALSDTAVFCTDDKEPKIEAFFRSVVTPYEIPKLLLDVGNTDKDDGHLIISASMPYPEGRAYSKTVLYWVMPAHGQTLAIVRYLHDDNRDLYGDN